MSRTAYVARLRRAFLLRVHPDRFRDENVRVQQAALVKSLANRMLQSDFTAWMRQREPSYPNRQHVVDDNTDLYPYVMEKRDGSLLTSSLSLGTSVDEILNSMASALKRSGAASLPVPPNDTHKPKPSSTDFRTFTSGTTASSKTGSVDHRYNVRSNRGRDLSHFLGGEVAQLHDAIRERRAARIDAQAVALQVRRVYQFAAVDATETGWSSASVAVLLRRLLSLHEEFSDKFHVTSFYPVRLVFSPRDVPDDCKTAALDLYGGILRLNPASTSIQWLEALQLVTDGSLREIQLHRDCLLQRTKAVQGSLCVKLKKGFTCTSRDYHIFLDQFSARSSNDNISSNETDSFLPMLEPVQAVVEAESSCRRAVVTNSGLIRLGAGMSEGECIESISRLSATARERSDAENANVGRLQDAISAVQWQLGLQKVYRTGAVSHAEFLDCLLRFLMVLSPQEQESEQQQLLHQSLTGHSLAIAATGHFCHLADDGSVVIPHNWS